MKALSDGVDRQRLGLHVEQNRMRGRVKKTPGGVFAAKLPENGVPPSERVPLHPGRCPNRLFSSGSVHAVRRMTYQSQYLFYIPLT